MSGQGISSSDFLELETAKVADISSYIYLPDTPPPTIDTGVLPANLQTKVSECDGNNNCKLITYDFISDIGDKASSSPYLIQLEATDKDPNRTNVSVLAKVGTNPVTSLGIPTDNLDAQYDPNRLLLTPPIVSGPIGYSYREGTAVLGTPTSTVASTSADACADTCTINQNCQGFNFDENASSCALFSLVDTEAVISVLAGGSSNTTQNLTLNLKNPVTGLAVAQTIDGLDDYINGTITITNVASTTQIQIGFSTQIVRAIPENTRFRIKAPTTISALQSYVYEKEHINYIGVNGNETYGYNAIFNISTIPGLPTQTNGAISSSGTTVITELIVPVNMSGINAALSTGTLPIVRVGQGSCTSGVISMNDVQTTVCGCNQTSVDEPLCKIPMNVKSYTSTNITFRLPTNSLLQYGSSSGSPLNLTAIEFTATLAAGNVPVPSDRIIGWTGAIRQASGPAIPVTVKSFTTSTITFSFPAQSYGVINAQSITLSDTQGRGCQDIKACNASIQRLLDDPQVSSFSTKDLVTCSGCNERAYKKQSTGASFGSKLREYLWFENAGVFACTASAPPGTTLNARCEPVCATPANGDSAVYDNGACRVTCRTGFYWNGTACISCPSVTLPTNITACPPLTSPTGFTISRLSTCEPRCELSTADSNADTTTTYNAIDTTVSCTKTCNLGYGKDSTTSICCATPTFGTNTKIGSYGTTSCNANPCAVDDNTSTYCEATYNSGACSISCKTRGTDETGTTGSYTSDGKCTFSCSTTSPNATANPATDANGNPYCAFGCSTGYYKPTSAFTCCANITSDTGTTPIKSATDCTFTCAISDTTTYPTSSHQASVSGRTCVLGCKPPSTPTGTTATTPTVGGSCSNFMCGLAQNYSTYTSSVSGHGCVLGCAPPSTPTGTVIATAGTTAGGCTDFTCGLAPGYSSTNHTSTKINGTCVLACQPGYIQYPNSGSQLCCQPGYFPYNGVCTVVVDQNIIRDEAVPYSVSANWCYDVTGITTTEAWWTDFLGNQDFRPSVPARTNSQAGCPSGFYVGAGTTALRKHVRCSSGYSIDLDLVTGNFGNDICYLNSFLQWTKTYRSGFTCPVNPTVVCNGTTYPARFGGKKFHGYCIAFNTSCTSATLTCTGTYNRYNLPDSEPIGICASL